MGREEGKSAERHRSGGEGDGGGGDEGNCCCLCARCRWRPSGAIQANWCRGWKQSETVEVVAGRKTSTQPKGLSVPEGPQGVGGGQGSPASGGSIGDKTVDVPLAVDGERHCFSISIGSGIASEETGAEPQQPPIPYCPHPPQRPSTGRCSSGRSPLKMPRRHRHNP